MITVETAMLCYPRGEKALVSIQVGIRAFPFAFLHSCWFMLSTYSPFQTSSQVYQKWTFRCEVTIGY